MCFWGAVEVCMCAGVCVCMHFVCMRLCVHACLCVCFVSLCACLHACMCECVSVCTDPCVGCRLIF